MAVYRLDSAQLEPPPEVPPEPADVMLECMHHEACRMQWERMNGALDEERIGWMDDIARLLGCGEDCECEE